MYDKQRFLTMLAAGMCSKARKGTELPSLYLAAGLRGEAQGDAYIWETIYDGQLTEDMISSTTARRTSYNWTGTRKLGWDSDYIRATIDGETLEGVLPLGNEYLSGVADDTGDNFEVRIDTVYVRTGGTHTMKIVRRVPLGAYYYNGFTFPKMDDWDVSTHPFAYICGSGPNWYLRISPIEFCMTSDGKFLPKNGESGFIFLSNRIYGAEEVWRERTESTYTASSLDAPIWCNKNVYNADGSLFLAASEPVPVYK